ncbi:hypothetical protein Q8A73_020970 [Channa argus]|nr:hypothetical protein Q8A73_020970 [Channa argus]
MMACSAWPQVELFLSRDSNAHRAQSGAPPPPLRQPSSHSRRSIRISRPGGPESTSSSEHPFHNCPPSSAHRRHQACFIRSLLFASARIIFLCLLHLHPPRWFYASIPFSKEIKLPRDAEHHLDKFDYFLIRLEISSGHLETQRRQTLAQDSPRSTEALRPSGSPLADVLLTQCG